MLRRINEKIERIYVFVGERCGVNAQRLLSGLEGICVVAVNKSDRLSN